MKGFIHRHHTWLAVILTFACAGLFASNLLKRGILTAHWLASHKDAISAASDLVQVTLVVVAAVFSYYRFFHGRTFSSRAEPGINVSVHSTTGDYFIHAILVAFKNVGTIPIWDPRPTVALQTIGPGGASEIAVADRWQEQSLSGDNEDRLPVVEAGETVSFVMHKQVPKTEWIVIYGATIVSQSGDVWATGKTVSNRVPKDA